MGGGSLTCLSGWKECLALWTACLGSNSCLPLGGDLAVLRMVSPSSCMLLSFLTCHLPTCAACSQRRWPGLLTGACPLITAAQGFLRVSGGSCCRASRLRVVLEPCRGASTSWLGTRGGGLSLSVPLLALRNRGSFWAGLFVGLWTLSWHVLGPLALAGRRAPACGHPCRPPAAAWRPAGVGPALCCAAPSLEDAGGPLPQPLAPAPSPWCADAPLWGNLFAPAPGATVQGARGLQSLPRGRFHPNVPAGGLVRPLLLSVGDAVRALRVIRPLAARDPYRGKCAGWPLRGP